MGYENRVSAGEDTALPRRAWCQVPVDSHPGRRGTNEAAPGGETSCLNGWRISKSPAPVYYRLSRRKRRSPLPSYRLRGRNLPLDNPTRSHLVLTFLHKTLVNCRIEMPETSMDVPSRAHHPLYIRTPAVDTCVMWPERNVPSLGTLTE